MLQLIRMAWRNLGRHLGRTLLSLLAVMFGVLIVILFKGFIDGTMDTMLDTNINLNSGHIRVISPEYAVKERLLSLSYPVGGNGKTYSELVKDIRALPGVRKAFGRIRFGMMFVVGDEYQSVMGVGTVPSVEEQTGHLTHYLKGKGEGRLPVPGKQEVLMGAGLLRKLRLKVGDKVNAVFSTSFGSFKIATFQIVGKMASGIKLLDESVAYLPLDQAMQLLEMDDMVTEIVVFGKNTSQTNLLKTKVQNYLSSEKEDLKIIPWNQYNEMIVSLEKFSIIYNLIYILMLLLASFVVFNTLMMVVSERVREIGMLSALGMTSRQIKALFLLEGTLIALSGSFAGTILGGACNWLMSRTGIDLSRAMGMVPKELTMLPRIYPSYRFSVLVFSFILGVTVTILAAYLPARRASLLNPTEALRTL